MLVLLHKCFMKMYILIFLINLFYLFYKPATIPPPSSPTLPSPPPYPYLRSTMLPILSSSPLPLHSERKRLSMGFNTVWHINLRQSQAPPTASMLGKAIQVGTGSPKPVKYQRQVMISGIGASQTNQAMQLSHAFTGPRSLSPMQTP